MNKEIFIKIHGRVQGVGFRRWAVDMARSIGGVSGWVHNEYDGTVEILMSGEEEKIDKMLMACQKGSMFSRVDRIEYPVGRRSGFLPPVEEGVFRRI